MKNKKEIGKRLKSWIKANFGTIEKGALVLNTTAASLSASILNGRSYPSVELLLALETNNCDIVWLLTGKTKEERLIEEITELRKENVKLLEDNIQLISMLQSKNEAAYKKVAELTVMYNPKKEEK